METALPFERTLTQTDHARLTRLLARPGQTLPAAEAMQDMLDNSEVVPSPAVLSSPSLLSTAPVKAPFA